MAQKVRSTLDVGTGRYVNDPREDEARARESSSRADQALAMQRARQAQEFMLAVRDQALRQEAMQNARGGASGFVMPSSTGGGQRESLLDWSQRMNAQSPNKGNAFRAGQPTPRPSPVPSQGPMAWDVPSAGALQPGAGVQQALSSELGPAPAPEKPRPGIMEMLPIIQAIQAERSRQAETRRTAFSEFEKIFPGGRGDPSKDKLREVERLSMLYPELRPHLGQFLESPAFQEGVAETAAPGVLTPSRETWRKALENQLYGRPATAGQPIPGGVGVGAGQPALRPIPGLASAFEFLMSRLPTDEGRATEINELMEGMRTATGGPAARRPLSPPGGIGYGAPEGGYRTLPEDENLVLKTLLKALEDMQAGR